MRVLQHATDVVDSNTLGTIKAFSTALDLRLCYEEVVLDRDVASDFALLFNVALMALRDCTTEDLGSPTTLLTEAAKKAQTFCARTAEFATTLMVENLQEIFRVHPEHRELFEQVFVPPFTPSVLSQLKWPQAPQTTQDQAPTQPTETQAAEDDSDVPLDELLKRGRG